jgi:DNA-binding MarR family transcriptional regulator
MGRRSVNTPDVVGPVDNVDEAVDTVLRASRVLVSIAARSLALVNDKVTLQQYRALVVLSSRGPQNAGTLADALGVHSSTLTRLCDRLVGKGLLVRSEAPGSRREVALELTPSGRRLVRSVTARRRREIADVVGRLTKSERDNIVRALQAFGEAAGEATESAWLPGWSEG